MQADIFARREQHFVLWRGAAQTPPPTLIIGQLQLGAPVALVGEQRFQLQPAAGFPDLWVLPADHCHLTDGQVYHYWFEVTDTHPQRSGQRLRVTDPMAYTVDWRLLARRPYGPGMATTSGIRRRSCVIARVACCRAMPEAKPVLWTTNHPSLHCRPTPRSSSTNCRRPGRGPARRRTRDWHRDLSRCPRPH